MPDCYIALGGNQGNVRDTFARALEKLNQHPEITLVQTSHWLETTPVGSATEEPFLNGAAKLSVSLSPQALLSQLKYVEHELGRVRIVRWGARTLDLDLILYDQLVLESDDLQIPHPACWYRRFVLDPLVEIAPEVIHPVKKISIAKLQQRLLKQPFVFSLAGLPPDQADVLITQFQPQFPKVIFSCWETADNAPEPTLIAWIGSDQVTTKFEDLPLVPRLDATEYQGQTEQIVHLLQSALENR